MFNCLCMWLLAVEAAAACSAHILPHALYLLASLLVLCPRPSTRAANVWGRRTITHVCVHAVAPGAAPQCSYPMQKLPCGCTENPGRPAPIYSCGHLPSSHASHDTISTPTTTHTERTSSGSNGAPVAPMALPAADDNNGGQFTKHHVVGTHGRGKALSVV